ncbi:MAG: TetR/AcrR family transcriptional regulator [Nevskia sp.]|nr:TetR/AcrR family transcriptional regulator [Nevskia sp.]
MIKTNVPLGHQALKAQRTREKLINATIELIKEGGFAAASSSRIAQRVDMTWGAAQHHFRSKEEILEAILALAYNRFIEVMDVPELHTGSMADRIHHFVERMWVHYQSDYCWVSVEILLATRGDETHPVRAWEQRRGRAHLKVIRDVFHDTKISDAKIREALTFAHCCITGLSMENVFERKVRNLSTHLHHVKMALQIMLSGL